MVLLRYKLSETAAIAATAATAERDYTRVANEIGIRAIIYVNVL